MIKRGLHLLVLLLFACCLLISQFQVCSGLQKAYQWDHLLYGETNTYQASLETSDSWQVDSTVNITFRLTLVVKGPALNYSEPATLRVKIQGDFFIMEENKHDFGDEILMNVGDYLEENVSFYIPAEKVGRGQTDNVSIVFELRYNERDNIEGKFVQTTYGPTNYEAMYVDLSRPLLSIFEMTIIVILAISICGMVAFLVYRVKKRRTDGIAQ